MEVEGIRMGASLLLELAVYLQDLPRRVPPVLAAGTASISLQHCSQIPLHFPPPSSQRQSPPWPLQQATLLRGGRYQATADGNTGVIGRNWFSGSTEKQRQQQQNIDQRRQLYQNIDRRQQQQHTHERQYQNFHKRQSHQTSDT